MKVYTENDVVSKVDVRGDVFHRQEGVNNISPEDFTLSRKLVSINTVYKISLKIYTVHAVGSHNLVFAIYFSESIKYFVI